MDAEGPQLENLTRRLAECPPEFLMEPRALGTGMIHVAAVVADLLTELGGTLLAKQAQPFTLARDSKERQWLRGVLVASWLLHDPWFRQRQSYAAPALEFMRNEVAELASLVQPRLWVEDAERREELARLCLKRLGLRPGGESVEAAQDRLTTLSSVERKRIMKATQEAERRARDIRDAMAKKAADEAAAKYNRE